MLKKIQTENYIIILRNSSPNIFDIDSITLLIGKNGSGKTLTLKGIINTFNPNHKDSLKSNYRLHIDGVARVTSSRLNSWGLVYYTPAQNRPQLRSSKNFIDASKRQVRDILKIEEHKTILSAFDVELTLKATLSSDLKRIGSYLAENLINKKSSFNTQNNSFDLEKALLIKSKLNTITTTEFDQEDFESLNNDYSNELNRISDKILNHFSQIEGTDEHRIFACFATVQHMIGLKKIATSTIIEFVRVFLRTSIFTPSKATLRQLEPFITIASGALELIEKESLDKSRPNKPLISLKLITSNDRTRLDQNPGRIIFDIGFPEVSSGQWAIMRQTIAIYEALIELSKKPNITDILLLIDEGDAFLHLDWQRRYILQLNTFLADCKQKLGINNLQLIIATHSPILATDMPREFVCAMDRNDYATLHPSFAAPLQYVLNRSFSSRTIGEFATREINKTIKNIKTSVPTERDQYIISMIDDPVIKNEIEHMIENRKRS